MNIRAAKQGAFEVSDIAFDVGGIAGCSVKDPAESAEAGARGSIPRRSTNNQQLALHVTDYYCHKTLADLRAMGACGRKATRRLADDEFDTNQFSLEQGDGAIY